MEFKIDTKNILKLTDLIKKQLNTNAKGVKAGYYDNKSYSNGFKIVDNAIIQNNGTKIRRVSKKGKTFIIDIPKRPFLEKASNRQNLYLHTFLRAIKGNENTTIEQALLITGEVMKNEIKKQIDKTVTPVNAKSTIQRKHSSHPLINTGTLRGSVRSEIIRSKENGQ